MFLKISSIPFLSFLLAQDDSSAIILPILIIGVFSGILLGGGIVALLPLFPQLRKFWTNAINYFGLDTLFKQQEKEAMLLRNYTWTFDPSGTNPPLLATTNFGIKISINKAHYNWFKTQKRNLNIKTYHSYAQNPSPEVRILASELFKHGQAHGYTRYGHICNVLAFVQQCIRYTQDISPETGLVSDYPKYPIETLVEGCGDCEDHVILAGAILACMGFDVAVLISPYHAALGVANIPQMSGDYVVHPISNTSYFYTEMTSVGWIPGQVPEKFQPSFNNGDFEALPI